MIKYQVRSKELIDVMNELTHKRLIKSPYFQRNLVWRDIHKIDFIKTITLGLPIPQIFIAKGEIDVESMTTHSCVVDGQQRLTAIQQFIAGDFNVDGIAYKDLGKDKKEEFLKYQVPIIDLDIKQSDPLLKEIFKRLNRTFYALSNIEKQATEYAASDFMLIAKALTDQLFFEKEQNNELGERELDPLIPSGIITKAKKLKVPKFQYLILETGAFTVHEIARKVHLSFVLNIIATCISGWYNRNVGVIRLLELSEPEIDFDGYIALSLELEKIANFIILMKLKSNSYWLNKANLYSLIVLLYQRRNELQRLTPEDIYNCLKKLENNLPPTYAEAAKEAVNNKKERMVRNDILEKALFAPLKLKKPTIQKAPTTRKQLAVG